MSKYYKAEDVINTLADQWRFEATMDSPYASNDINGYLENAKLLFSDLPTIEVSEDCISRSALRKEMEMYGAEITLIDTAPNVAPSRAEGEWIVADDESILFTVYKCSVCGSLHGSSLHNYCPNCGAKMKG